MVAVFLCLLFSYGRIMADYSKYQKKVISRFYDNREGSDEQRLAELATELFLASPKKAVKLWETARDIMIRLRVPPSRVEHVFNSQRPAILAEVVQELQSGVLKRVPAPAPGSNSAPQSSGNQSSGNQSSGNQSSGNS